MTASRIIIFVAFAFLLIAGISAVDASIERSGTPHTVTDESWTPDAGSITTLNNSHIEGAYYADSVTVRDENGTEVEADVDYEWYSTNGTIKALSGGELDGDTSASIDYDYRTTSELQQDLAATIGGGWQVAELMVIVGMIAVVLGGISILGRV